MRINWFSIVLLYEHLGLLSTPHFAITTRRDSPRLSIAALDSWAEHLDWYRGICMPCAGATRVSPAGSSRRDLADQPAILKQPRCFYTLHDRY